MKPQQRLQPVRVLFLDHVPRMSGAEQSLADLVIGLKQGPVEPVVALPSDGPLAAELRAHGVLVRMVPMSRRMLETSRVRLSRRPLLALARLLAFAVAAFRIWRLIREVRPAIVHTNTLKSHLLAALPCCVARVPLVWHMRDILPRGWLLRALMVFAHLATVIVVPSRAVAEPFRGRRRLLRKLRLIPNGIRVKEFQDASRDRSLREMMGAGAGDVVVVVGIVGRIAPWKGQDVFLRAAAMLARRHPRAHFALIGAVLFPENDIPFEQHLHRQVIQLGLTDRVSFCGWQPAPESMAAIDVFVHASLEPEPFGRAIVEAMAAGKPIVASTGGAVTEIVPPAAGFVVPPGRPELLADALDRLLSDKKLRKRMGEAGAAVADSFFPVERTVHSVAQVYRALAQARARRIARRRRLMQQFGLHPQRLARAFRRNSGRTKPGAQPWNASGATWTPRSPIEHGLPSEGRGSRDREAPRFEAEPFKPWTPPVEDKSRGRRTRRGRIRGPVTPPAMRPPVVPPSIADRPVTRPPAPRPEPDIDEFEFDDPVEFEEPTPFDEPPPPRRAAIAARAATASAVRVRLPEPVAAKTPVRSAIAVALPAQAPAPHRAEPLPRVRTETETAGIYRAKPAYELVKRFIDIAISGAALLLGMPVWIVVAVLIKLESPGTVFHRGTVHGKSCKPFTYLKFRSMRIDGDDRAHRKFIEKYVKEGGGHEVDGEVVYKLLGDDRITGVGRWIRKFSIDEIPQMWNVLRGDMSIVGPRPPLEYEYAHYDERARERLRVKPGITGLQQVWHRHTASFEDKLKMDMNYIRDRSLWLDVKLIAHTILAMARGH